MKYLIGNWKMNLSIGESLDLLEELKKSIDDYKPLEVVLCPSLLALMPVYSKNNGYFSIGAQNCFYEDKGSYTGEVSASQLKELVQYCLVGHSERRQIFGEKNTDINLKVKACLRNNIKPILCIGETLSQRQDNETESVLRDQIDGALMGVKSDEISKVIIAYEPVWAIGSGLVPEERDLNIAIEIIKTQIAFMYGNLKVPVLYGGSVDGENAKDLVSIPQLDGLLVGSSSLNAQKFAIIEEIIKN